MMGSTPTRPAPPSRARTMAQALPDELERVIILRERSRVKAETMGPSAPYWCADVMMTAAIDSAKAALASGDVLHVLQAHATLQGMTDD